MDRMCLPAARAERVNNGKARLNRIAGLCSGVKGEGHRYSPSYTSTPPLQRTASYKEDPNTHGTGAQRALCDRNGAAGNSDQPIPGSGLRSDWEKTWDPHNRINPQWRIATGRGSTDSGALPYRFSRLNGQVLHELWTL